MGVRSLTMCPESPGQGLGDVLPTLLYSSENCYLANVRRVQTQLILRPTGIDVLIPQQDTAGHALNVAKTILPQKSGKLHGTATGSAMNDDFVVLVLFQRADVLADLLERDQLRAVDVGDVP